MRSAKRFMRETAASIIVGLGLNCGFEVSELAGEVTVKFDRELSAEESKLVDDALAKAGFMKREELKLP
jgi:hypothetical protein